MTEMTKTGSVVVAVVAVVVMVLMRIDCLCLVFLSHSLAPMSFCFPGSLFCSRSIFLVPLVTPIKNQERGIYTVVCLFGLGVLTYAPASAHTAVFTRNTAKMRKQSPLEPVLDPASQPSTRFITKGLNTPAMVSCRLLFR